MNTSETEQVRAMRRANGVNAATVVKSKDGSKHIVVVTKPLLPKNTTIF